MLLCACVRWSECAFCAYRLTRPRYYRPCLYPMLKYSFWKLEINIPRKITAIIKHNLPRVAEEEKVIFATLVLHWGHTKSLSKAETHILIILCGRCFPLLFPFKALFTLSGLQTQTGIYTNSLVRSHLIKINIVGILVLIIDWHSFCNNWCDHI